MASSDAKTSRGARALVSQWWTISGEYPRQTPELADALEVAWLTCRKRYPVNPSMAFRLAAEQFRGDEASKFGLVTLARQMGRWLDKIPKAQLPSPYSLAVAELRRAEEQGDKAAIGAATAEVERLAREMNDQ